MRKYILWDFDGTLAYRNGMWSGALLSLLEKQGIYSVKKDDIRPLLKNGFPWHSPEISHSELFKGLTFWEYINDLFENVLLDLGIENDLAKKISTGIKDEYLNINYWKVFDDSIIALNKMIELGYMNVIISNHVPELEELVDRLGLKKYFFKIFTSANIGFEKPNCRFYEYVFDNLEKSSKFIAIGDSYSADITGAKQFDIPAILVRVDNLNNYEYYQKDLFDIDKYLKMNILQ